MLQQNVHVDGIQLHLNIFPLSGRLTLRASNLQSRSIITASIGKGNEIQISRNPSKQALFMQIVAVAARESISGTFIYCQN
jgi:hypothetical protein